MIMEKAVIKSPIGSLKIIIEDDKLCSIDFLDNAETSLPEKQSLTLKKTIKQLGEYFAKERREFDLPISFEKATPTKFELKAWNVLLKIPYGETISYKAQSRKIKTLAYRSVGKANGKNPLPIVVPCHRVIMFDGKLGGFSSGIWRKEFLLKLEGTI
ncbi:MAG: methylated-DNA--[protein]-cysteine S-methyltransferase [Pseudomonadota bacterium]